MIIYFRHLSDDCYRETVACTLNQKFAYYKETSFLSTLRSTKKSPDNFFFLFQKERQLFRQDPNMADCLIEKLPALTIYLRVFFLFHIHKRNFLYIVYT